MSRVIVVGSISQDVTVTVDRLPDPDETPSGTLLTYDLSGKGANQAAAAAHSRVPIFFVGAIGADPSGQCLRAELVSHGVDATHLREVGRPSGAALITINSSSENTIILGAGANTTVAIEPARASLFPAPADVVILQAEIPAEADAEALTWAHSFGAHVLLNLVPARPTDATFMVRVDILVVNETEAGLALGMPAPAGLTEAIGVAWVLRGLGLRHVMVTLSAGGAAWVLGSEAGHFPALTLGEAVDTTRAGSVYVDALAVTMALNKPSTEAVADGIRARSTAVLTSSAAPSYIALPRITRA